MVVIKRSGLNNRLHYWQALSYCKDFTIGIQAALVDLSFPFDPVILKYTHRLKLKGEKDKHIPLHHDAYKYKRCREGKNSEWEMGDIRFART